MAYRNSGRETAAADAAHHLAIIEPSLADPLAGWFALQGLVENALANDRGSVPGLVDRLTQRAGEIGAPTLLSHTSYYRALSALYAEDPRNPERAFSVAHDGLLLARRVGDVSSERANLLTLAQAAVAQHRPDATEICRDAIARIYDFRMWHVVWILIETVASLLAAAGSRQEAAVLYGHLEAHRPPLGMPAARRARERGLDRVHQLAGVGLLMAQGADMDRDELVAYTLERLEPVAEPQIEPA
jgi:hypothetical protein